MAAAVCGCGLVRGREGEDTWIVDDVASRCPLGHVVGDRGRVEGEPTRVSGVGECVTLVFDHARKRRPDRIAMLATPSAGMRSAGRRG
jgi:hypothetical protein